MPERTSIEQFYESNYLWPPIADAVDTFLRRREDADAYERIWRLIHVWEAMTTVLSLAASARIVTLDDLGEAKLKIRECLHGSTWDAIDGRLKSGTGVLDGVNEKRIEILRFVSQDAHDFSDSRFLQCLRAFVCNSLSSLDNPSEPTVLADSAQEAEEGQPGTRTESQNASTGSNRSEVLLNMGALVSAWNRVCDVPEELARNSNLPVNVLQAISYVNNFRNRFAHVPFPYDPLDNLAREFEALTETLLQLHIRAQDITTADRGRQCYSPLAGGFVRGTRLWRGGMLSLAPSTLCSDRLCFVYPSLRPQEPWSASPFVHIDRQLRPYVLTRLKQRSVGTWEFTRFRAEANAVITYDDESWLEAIPAPHEQDYQTDDVYVETAPDEGGAEISAEDSRVSQGDAESSVSTSPRRLERQSEAIDAVRRGEFDSAIDYFERLVQDRPNYHVGWLRLGNALREKAARQGSVDQTEAIATLDRSRDAFTQASHHMDSAYAAEALYGRSKTYVRTYELNGDESLLAAGQRDAMQACKLSPDSKYQSWLEYLERRYSLSLND